MVRRTSRMEMVNHHAPGQVRGRVTQEQTMSTQTIPPDLATLSSLLTTWQDRAKRAEKRASDLDARLSAQSGQISQLIFLLLKNGIPIPRNVTPTVEIASGDGWLAVRGVMRFETGAAADELILQLMDHARRAFPDSFPEVF